MSNDYSAEIDRMMGGAGGSTTPGAPLPSSDDPPTQIQNPGLNEHGQQAPGGRLPSADDPAIVALKDQLDAQQREISELRSRPALPTSEGTVAQQTQQPLSPDVETLKKNIESAFLKDPGGTLLALAAHMQAENKREMASEIAKATGGIKSDVTGGHVEAFRNKMLADPILAPAVDEFDKLVKTVGPNLTPGNMGTQLDALASTALGNTFRNRLPGARQQAPPVWTGPTPGSTADAGGSTAPTAKMTNEMEAYAATMIELGIPKDVINERLKNWDHEGGFTKQS